MPWISVVDGDGDLMVPELNVPELSVSLLLELLSELLLPLRLAVRADDIGEMVSGETMLFWRFGCGSGAAW